MIAYLFIIFLTLLIVGGANFLVSIVGAELIIPILSENAGYTALNVTEWIIKNAANYGTFAIALFIVSGNIMTKGRLTEKIFNVFMYYLGDKDGFMPIITILTCMFYGAISGSGPATVAAVAAMTYPMLTRFGYDKKFVSALLMASGSLGMVIPPSLPLMFYGILTEQNISDLFKISLVIGLFIGTAFIVYTYIYCKKNPVDQSKIKDFLSELRKKPFIAVFKESFLALLMPFIILGGIFSNILSTTDAAAISLVYTIIVSVYIYKEISINEVLMIIKESLPIAGGLSLLLTVAYSFSNTIQALNGPKIIGDFITSTFNSSTALFIAIIVAFLVMGMFMDGGATLGILTPILYPVIQSLNINTLIFGCIIILCIALGLSTPPFGLSLFVVVPISKLQIMDIVKQAIPYLLIMIVAIFLFAMVPSLVTWVL